MVNLLFQTINLSFYVVSSIISDSKNEKNFNKFILCYRFSCKNPTKTINLLFCIVFASIKLPQHVVPKTNYCLNETIIFLLSCCVVSVVGQKKCYCRPLMGANQSNSSPYELWKSPSL